MAIEDDILDFADLYLERYGSQALVRAPALAADLKAEGNTYGHAIWELVASAIKEKQRMQQSDQLLK
jgi:hypothetical protein